MESDCDVGDRRDGRQGRSREVVDAEDRREPVRLERHHPVDGDDRDRDRKDRNENGRQPDVPGGQLRVAGAVLAPGIAGEEVIEQVPEDEDRTNRAMKNGTLRYASFPFRIVSAATASGCVQWNRS